MPGTSGKTEKVLFGTLSVLLLVLVFNFYTNEPNIATQVASAESQGEDSGDSGDSAKSSASEKSAESEDDTSEPSVASTPSEKSTPSTTRVRTRTTVGDTTSEQSTPSQQGASVSSVDDESEQLSQESVKSVKSEENVITTVSTEGNVSIVKREGKLFFLIPVEIESQVTTSDTGTVIAEKRNFLNWLKAVFSF